MLLAWEGRFDRAEEICRRAVDLQEQYISGNAGLQIVGAHSRLGYVHYLRGNYDEALRAYEREMAFVSSGDHALRERTQIELNVKIGAVYHRQGQTEAAGRHFTRALKAFEERVARGADDPFTRYYIACMLALRGEHERALESLKRVSQAYPELTAARALRDPDLDSLRERSAFQELLTVHV
jgi:tetratricopeptide (TPR) repeat protein